MIDNRKENIPVIHDRRRKNDRIIHNAVHNLLKPYLTSSVVVSIHHSVPECSLADFRRMVSRSVSINFEPSLNALIDLINA